jgi:hypothetical protein
MSTKPVGIVERAYQIAPESQNLDEVRAKLRREGYIQIDEHLSGPTLRNALKKLTRG